MPTTVVNPYLKKPARQQKAKEGRPSYHYGEAQAAFIQRTRDAIKADPCGFLLKNDWRRIKCSPQAVTCSKKATVGSFYVKDHAVWIPHVIIPRYIPTCRRCGMKSSVDVGNWRWIECPKILYGLHTHRYLDTVYYRCDGCESDFVAYADETLKKDAAEITGIMNFRCSFAFGVDEDLYSFITTHTNNTTISIHRTILSLHSDHWTNQAALHCRAVMGNCVRHRFTGFQQSTLDNMVVASPQINLKRYNAVRIERELRSKEAQFKGDIHFADIFRRKENRNSIGDVFPGIGKKKCLVLLDRGIYTAKELLAYDGMDPAIKWRWKDIVQKHFDDLEVQVNQLRQTFDAVKTDLEYEELVTPAPTNNNPPAVAAARPPIFSAMNDRVGFNCRTVSKSAIDRIILADFKMRKPIQEAKMRSIPATVLKIDWHDKIAKKVKVYTGHGKCFSPFQSAVSIQNEDALTIFWKFYAETESIDTVSEDLRLLKKRQDILKSVIVLIYVDNCCQVRAKLLLIFPGALVKCDTFHWCERWDEIMYDKNSKKTIVFCTLLRQAMYITEHAEITRAKDLLISQGKNPTSKAIFKEAKSTIPPPDILETRIMAVLHTLMDKDNEVDRARTTCNGSKKKESRFFKRGEETLNTIVNQMEHVKRGSLSDPDDQVVKIHRYNKRTKKTYTARSTGSNEVDNRYILASMQTPTISITKADIKFHNYYEGSNNRK